MLTPHEYARRHRKLRRDLEHVESVLLDVAKAERMTGQLCDGPEDAQLRERSERYKQAAILVNRANNILTEVEEHAADYVATSQQ